MMGSARKVFVQGGGKEMGRYAWKLGTCQTVQNHNSVRTSQNVGIKVASNPTARLFGVSATGGERNIVLSSQLPE